MVGWCQPSGSPGKKPPNSGLFLARKVEKKVLVSSFPLCLETSFSRVNNIRVDKRGTAQNTTTKINEKEESYRKVYFERKEPGLK